MHYGVDASATYLPSASRTYVTCCTSPGPYTLGKEHAVISQKQG